MVWFGCAGAWATICQNTHSLLSGWALSQVEIAHSVDPIHATTTVCTCIHKGKGHGLQVVTQLRLKMSGKLV